MGPGGGLAAQRSAGETVAAHLFGGNVVRKIFASDQTDFTYLEVILKL